MMSCAALFCLSHFAIGSDTPFKLLFQAVNRGTRARIPDSLEDGQQGVIWVKNKNAWLSPTIRNDKGNENGFIILSTANFRYFTDTSSFRGQFKKKCQVKLLMFISHVCPHVSNIHDLYRYRSMVWHSQRFSALHNFLGEITEIQIKNHLSSLGTSNLFTFILWLFVRI